MDRAGNLPTGGDPAGDDPARDDMLPEGSLLDTLILLPVTDTVLMPGMVMPLSITRPDAAAALQDAARTQQHIAVVLQREPTDEAPGAGTPG